MPATTGSILTNIDRTYATQDEKLIGFLESAIESAETDKAVDLNAWAHEVWDEFITAADQAHYADHIPGTVGYQFRRNYGTLQQRGRRPVEKAVTLTGKQIELVDGGAVDFSAALRYRREGDSIIFTARTPVIRALRKAVNNRNLESNARRSLQALLTKVHQT